MSAIQCNVECRLSEEDAILKENPPPHESSPPQRRHAYGGARPPSYDPEQARLLEEFGIALRAN